MSEIYHNINNKNKVIGICGNNDTDFFAKTNSSYKYLKNLIFYLWLGERYPGFDISEIERGKAYYEEFGLLSWFAILMNFDSNDENEYEVVINSISEEYFSCTNDTMKSELSGALVFCRMFLSEIKNVSDFKDDYDFEEVVAYANVKALSKENEMVSRIRKAVRYAIDNSFLDEDNEQLFINLFKNGSATKLIQFKNGLSQNGKPKEKGGKQVLAYLILYIVQPDFFTNEIEVTSYEEMNSYAQFFTFGKEKCNFKKLMDSARNNKNIKKDIKDFFS